MLTSLSCPYTTVTVHQDGNQDGNIPPNNALKFGHFVTAPGLSSIVTVGDSNAKRYFDALVNQINLMYIAL